MKYILTFFTLLSMAAISWGQFPKSATDAAARTRTNEYKGWFFSASLDINAVPSESASLAGTAMLQAGKRDWDFFKTPGQRQ